LIDHVSIPVSDLAASGAFYDLVLAPMGYRRLADRPASIGYGKQYPEFWLNLRADGPAVDDNTGHHVCLRARDVDTVRSFYEAALDAGGVDDGAPGPRRGEMTSYFGAFIRDLDRNRVEVMTVGAD
jgi:catechol 2,3-dioxygenase-like lactoylglutathione lyase family enzyme